MLTAVFVGGGLGAVVFVAHLIDKAYQAGRAKRIIRDINYTRDEALRTMNSAHQRFREHVDRQTRR